ncbi:hybrid sensor histidine kinase/response regulator transcription factor [Larkinella terrae]|uniref:histidine kinase n=1 Tax=Larkinella terrae TaxID=2025311 RepID=A0A7K0EN95_9BACT|nr:two-component regulator propeller domain-containing protein [Larkinella terrae]MRS62918.1 response regulator [Larkinella terrae]
MRFLLLFLLFLPVSLIAQLKGWQEITISDGLSQGMVYDLKQDQKGFIWIATKDGLNRYDGLNFKIFTHDPYNSYSISENNCSALLIDRHQRLWIGTGNQGLNLFDDRTRRFYHLTISDQAAPNAGNYEIRLLSEDPEGNIWVGTDTHKLFRIKLPASLKSGFPDQTDFTKSVQIKTIDLRQRFPYTQAHYFSFRPDGKGYIGTAYGMYEFGWKQPDRATQLPLFHSKTGDYHAMYGDYQQDYWFASNSNQIEGWHQGVHKTIALPQKNYFGVKLKAIDKHTLAIATPDHLWLMSPAELFRQDSLTIRRAYEKLPPNLATITSLLKDRTGSIWAGTSGYGLRKFNPRIKQFQVYLPNTSLSRIYVDRQGQTYVRFQYAYEQLDRKANRLVPFLDPNLPEADRRQRNLMQDRRGNFWVSNTHFQTHQQHIFKFSPDWKLLKKYPLPSNTNFGFVGNQTLEDPRGRLWIGVNNGKLLRFDPVTEAFEVFSYQNLLPQSGAEIETYALHLEPDGTLWIGTQKGLIRVKNSQTNPTFSVYKNKVANRRSLSNDFVLSLAADPNQADRFLWIGTKGGGLERLDKQTGQFEHFTEAQGLPNSVIYGILPDEFKNLWLSTNRGLSRFNPAKREFRNYTKADGLQDDEFNSEASFKTASGELLFAGVNGLTGFQPKEVSETRHQRPLANIKRPLANIIGLKINNEAVTVGGENSLLTQGIEYTPRLDLAHDQNLVTLEFGVMDYTNSGKNRYRYRLSGIDRDWVEAGTNRFANYAHLPDGNYQFEMMGSADGEVWSLPVPLQIRVHPPFYRTWWAYIIYLLALVLLGWQLYRFQRQRLILQQQVVFEQKEASRLAELDALKTRLFANISHEFRTPLTLILGPIEQLVEEYSQDSRFPLLQRNARRLLSLINQLLDLSKLEAGQLQPEFQSGDLVAFFRTLAGSFESLAEDRNIRFSYKLDETEYWAEFDPDKLEKIVTNLLSNALKFTPAGQEVHLEVMFPNEGKSLVFTIRDTGIGIAPAQQGHIFERFYQVDGNLNRVYEGSGIGLALVRELVRVLKGSIGLVSSEGVGTTFTVQLPVRKTAKPPGLDWPYLTDVDPGLVSAERVENPQPVSESQTAAENILLIIDDNADIRAFVRSIFETDYQILEAVDGQDGLEKATTLLPNLVICDLMMPRLDGFAFCRMLKSQEATSHIPVVMLTAKAEVENRIEGFEQGADDYLTKPFYQSEIRARVRNLLQKQIRLQQYFSAQTSQELPANAAGKPHEEEFLQKVRAVIDHHLSSSAFNVDQLSQELNLSQRQLVRKIKALTDQTAVEFIRNQRLERAATYLQQNALTVSEVAYQVGFESLSYFTKVFQERFGVLPSAYAQI